MNTVCSVAAYMGLNTCQEHNEIAALKNDFISHINSFGYSYGTKEEFDFRFEIYKTKDAEYKKINSNEDFTFTVGHNKFSTWTAEEYKKLLGYRGPQSFNENETFASFEEPNDVNVDWRNQGAVNPVQDQGQCGSCWAFSAVAAIEGANFNQMEYLLKLSEQQVVSCDTTCGGCQGGWQAYAMTYAETHPLVLESHYPYSATTGTCNHTEEAGGAVKVNGFEKVLPGGKASLIAAIAQGVVSVTVEADGYPFQGYQGGILNDPGCGTQLDHAIAAVGYGTEAGQDYYIVRNSWGSSWGDKGYIKIAATPSGKGICGIQQVSVIPHTK